MKKAPSLVMLKVAAKRHGLSVEHDSIEKVLRIRIATHSHVRLVTVFYGDEAEFTYAEARRFLGGALEAL